MHPDPLLDAIGTVAGGCALVLLWGALAVLILLDKRRPPPAQ